MPRDANYFDLTKQVLELLKILLQSDHTQDFEYIYGNARNAGKTWIQTDDGHFFGLDEDGAERYAEVIDKVMSQWKNRLSFKYAENQISELLVKSLSDVVRGRESGKLPTTLSNADIGSVRDRINDLAAAFDRESQKEWIVYLPLSGIEFNDINGDSLEIGRACLKYMSGAEMDTLYKKLKLDSVIALPSPAATTQGGYREAVRKSVDTLKESICAVYQITAETGRAIEIAEEQTQDVLDLLAYFTSFMYSRTYEGAVRLQGEMARGKRTTLLLSSTTDAHYVANELTGAYMPVQITNDDIENMNRWNLPTMSAILQKEDPNNFELTVLSGIRWFAASRRQKTPEIEYVTLVTCLENCLTPKGSEPVGASIADGCALLLEGDLKQRLRLRKTVTDIYRQRSKIIHRGSIRSKPKRSQSDAECYDLDSCLAHLRVISRTLLAVLIKRIDEFKDKEELMTWIRETKMA